MTIKKRRQYLRR